jgi:hypothetical protein
MISGAMGSSTPDSSNKPVGDRPDGDEPATDESDNDEEQASGSRGPGGEESQQEAGEKTPLERSDRYTTTTVSEEEWIELMNRADPLEQRLQAQKAFDRTEPPARSIKAYQQETRYFLLYRGETPIKRLLYRAYETDVNVHTVEDSQLYEVQDLPPESFFQAGRMDLENQRRMAFALVFAEWEGGHVFEVEPEKDGRRIRLFDSTDPVSSPDDLDLSAAPVEPAPVDR